MSDHHADGRAVCLACGAINRLPAGSPQLAARCGTCHAPLFGESPPSVTAETLERQITKGTLPVVVDVWAPWCGPCRVMGPEYEKAAQALAPRARFVKLNSDQEQAISARMNIRGIPTMILFKEGREIDRVSGAMPAGRIAEWVSRHLD